MNLQQSLDDLVATLADRLADEAIEALKRREETTWLTQQELMEREDCSWQFIKQMESYGLQSIKQGKTKKYCLADVNEIKHLMKN
ncbi:hypothetical protein MX033_07805 [Streptococcus uberis]|uniref:hypothetical protein n=1 Tax=Streptococcus uberis TaxID=1349 RepID=UPI0027DB3250|nr:hypothetical protein [Streptococcus uberis]MCK1241352.1 hypothetical protein [Streptococcus uberis]